MIAIYNQITDKYIYISLANASRDGDNYRCADRPKPRSDARGFVREHPPRGCVSLAHQTEKGNETPRCLEETLKYRQHGAVGVPASSASSVLHSTEMRAHLYLAVLLVIYACVTMAENATTTGGIGSSPNTTTPKSAATSALAFVSIFAPIFAYYIQ